MSEERIERTFKIKFADCPIAAIVVRVKDRSQQAWAVSEAQRLVRGSYPGLGNVISECVYSEIYYDAVASSSTKRQSV